MQFAEFKITPNSDSVFINLNQIEHIKPTGNDNDKALIFVLSGCWEVDMPYDKVKQKIRRSMKKERAIK